MSSKTPTNQGFKDLTGKDVSVLFADQEISEIFCELLNARGANSHIVSDITQISECRHLITEPAYAKQIEVLPGTRCLIVGNTSDSSDNSNLYLSRPLTEEKIDLALEALFQQ